MYLMVAIWEEILTRTASYSWDSEKELRHIVGILTRTASYSWDSDKNYIIVGILTRTASYSWDSDRQDFLCQRPSGLSQFNLPWGLL